MNDQEPNIQSLKPIVEKLLKKDGGLAQIAFIIGEENLIADISHIEDKDARAHLLSDIAKSHHAHKVIFISSAWMRKVPKSVDPFDLSEEEYNLLEKKEVYIITEISAKSVVAFMREYSRDADGKIVFVDDGSEQEIEPMRFKIIQAVLSQLH